MLEDRRLAVLRAIVEDYVCTREPVGSKALVERYPLGVSSATIRNDMAALEEEGYIAQPHTSAGRIPTDLGYRAFVDRLSGVKPLSPAERRAISNFLAGAVDLDDVMARSVRLLAQLTRQVALVQYPSLVQSTVLHLEIVRLSSTRVLLVLIAATGRVEQRSVDLPAPVSEGFVTALRSRLLTAIIGQRCTDLSGRMEGLAEQFPADERPSAQAIIATLLEATVESEERRVMLGGTANLARYRDSFSTLEPVLEALEEQVVLLRLLGEVSGQVSVRIGHENPVEDLQSTSVVAAGYGRGSAVAAGVGVLGPTHMDYPGTMAAVHAVAQYLSRILDEN
ncbi:MAG: heat-inducible transcriptional repressor HrcA [Actinobacteria bacterium]|nr:heat-inducible transcriptional repressor HrcA [Actinomycetota bacterium]